MRLSPHLFAAIVLATPCIASPQGLRGKIRDLFRFGNCAEPLCLPSLAQQGNEHGNHFSPSTTETGQVILDFLTGAIGSAVGNLPVSATTSGATFSFVGGAPVKTTLSAGPIFAERAQTLGRGRVLLGANVSTLQFRSVRGIPLDALEFNITHENGQNPNVLGDPAYENDLLSVHSTIELDAYVTSLFLTYGLADRLDIGFAVPVVYASLRGRSRGEIIPFGPNTPHYFGGTAQNPDLSAVSSISGSAVGLGDVSARMKLNLVPKGASGGLAVLGEVRLPTGKVEDLLGSGDMSARVYAIVSGRYGNFSPHGNFGGVMRGGSTQNNSVLATAGFDQLITSRATFALDIITEWQMRGNALELPAPVVFTAPYHRSVNPTNIPNLKDNLFNASMGGKYATKGGVTFVFNALVPLNRGGMRPWSVLTGGIEYGF